MKLALWVSTTALVIVTGICAYQAAVISHLDFIIKILSSTSIN